MAKHSADDAQLMTALARLTPDQRQLLHLSYRCKLSHVEIGRVEGLPVDVVSRRIGVAMGALGRFLDEDQGRYAGRSEAIA